MVSPPVTVTTKEGKQIEKQDCFFGDVSHSVGVVLWGSNVFTKVEDRSYKLFGAGVCSFDSVVLWKVTVK